MRLLPDELSRGPARGAQVAHNENVGEGNELCLHDRRERLRRFLHWLGPATSAEFARRAGVSQADADATWSAKSSLVPVLITADMGWILAEDEPASTQRDAPRIEHVRFLAPGDPYIHPHAGLRVPVFPKTSQTDAGELVWRHGG